MKTFYFISIIVITLYISGCDKNTHLELLPSSYVQWVEDIENGHRITRDFEKVNYELLYKPIDYIISNELRRDSITHEEYSKLKDELQGMEYFTFKIFSKSNYSLASLISNGDATQYQRVSEYLAFEMQNDFKMIYDTDTVYPKLYHFEKDYDLSPNHTIVLGFPKPTIEKDNSDIKIVYNENLIGIGPMHFRIKKEVIEKQAQIILL